MDSSYFSFPRGRRVIGTTGDLYADLSALGEGGHFTILNMAEEAFLALRRRPQCLLRLVVEVRPSRRDRVSHQAPVSSEVPGG
jgi:hypothetical protein